MKDQISKKSIKNQILYTPLIGYDITIKNSKNPKHIGVSGTILAETSKFLIILTNGEQKRFKKDLIEFEILLDGQALYIDGRLLFSTLQIRLKKLK